MSYLEREQCTFDELPFNEVDSLVFSSLCYLRWERACSCVPSVSLDASSPQGVRLHDVLSLCDTSAIIQGNWLEDSKETELFLQACRASRRLRDVVVTFYADEMSEAIEKQFSATTFILINADLSENRLNGNKLDSADKSAANNSVDHKDVSKEGSANTSAANRRADTFNQDAMSLDKPGAGCLAYVAFRGTDGTFAGWKEDFNLSFIEVIPSHRSAAAYLSGIADALPGSLIVGGHSKGGNLAEYAALTCAEAVFNRIQGVYNHDGPSFLEDPSPRGATAAFETIYHKTVPESSVFGMILERNDRYRVVCSSAHAVFQHEPFTWQVEGSEFACKEGLNASAVWFDTALDQWLRQYGKEDRERLVDTVYAVLAAAGVPTFADFQQDLPANIRTVIETGARLNPQEREFVFRVISDFGAVLRDEALQKARPSSFSPFFHFGSSTKENAPVSDDT